MTSGRYDDNASTWRENQDGSWSVSPKQKTPPVSLGAVKEAIAALPVVTPAVNNLDGTYTTDQGVVTPEPGRVLLAQQGDKAYVVEDKAPIPTALIRAAAGGPSQSVAERTWTTVTMWDTNEVDPDPFSMWTSGDPSRITVPADGVYLVTFNCQFQASTLGGRVGRITINGDSEHGQTGEHGGSASANLTQGATFTGLLKLSAGDVLAAQVYQNSGSSLNLNTGSRGSLQPWFHVIRVDDRGGVTATASVGGGSGAAGSAAPVYYGRIRAENDYSLTGSDTVVVNWWDANDTEDSDTFLPIPWGSNGFTVPADGTYMVMGRIQFSASSSFADARVVMEITRNGSDADSYEQILRGHVSNSIFHIHTVPMFLSKGQVISLGVSVQGASGTLNLNRCQLTMVSTSGGGNSLFVPLTSSQLYHATTSTVVSQNQGQQRLSPSVETGFTNPYPFPVKVFCHYAPHLYFDGSPQSVYMSIETDSAEVLALPYVNDSWRAQANGTSGIWYTGAAVMATYTVPANHSCVFFLGARTASAYSPMPWVAYGGMMVQMLGPAPIDVPPFDYAWQDPVFENNFTDHNVNSPVGYRKLTSGQVMLRGYASVGTYTGADDVIFTLPAGWRPAQDLFFPSIVYLNVTGKQSHAIPARIRIDATGEVMLSRVSTTDFVQTGTAQVTFTGGTSASGSAVFPVPYLTTPNAVGNLQNANSYINGVGGGVSTTVFNIYLRDIRLANRSDTVQVSWMAQGTPDLSGINSHVALDGVTFLAEQ